MRRLVLFLMETSGALSPPARRHLRWLHRRSNGIDRTPYDNSATRGGGGKPFHSRSSSGRSGYRPLWSLASDARPDPQCDQ